MLETEEIREERQERVKKEIEKQYKNLDEKEKDKVYSETKRKYNTIAIVCFLFSVLSGAIMIILSNSAQLNNNTGTTEMPPYVMIVMGIIWIIISIITFICVIMFLRNKEKTIKFALKRQIKEQIKIDMINEKISKAKEYEKEQIGNFHIDKEVILPDKNAKVMFPMFSRNKILIDTREKKFIHVASGNYSDSIKFSDIISYEVYEDGDSVVKEVLVEH